MSKTLDARGVCKGFGDGARRLEVLRGVDMRVAPGELIAVIGASGIGKSTLLHILGGLDRCDRGSVHWDGRDIARLPDNELSDLRSRTLGFVFQFHHLLPELNALENVLLSGWVAARSGGTGGQALRSRALALLDRLGISGRAHALPHTLSGGERQRVAIARALINDPALVIADEPTGNLDPASGALVWELLASVCRESRRSVIVATHNHALAAGCDRTLLVADGALRSVATVPHPSAGGLGGTHGGSAAP